MGSDFAFLRMASNGTFLADEGAGWLGANSVEALVERAAELGLRHVTLADTNGLYLTHRLFKKAREVGIHPVIGARVTVSPDAAVTVLARTRKGYERLCRAVTARQLDPSFDLLEHVAGSASEWFILCDDPAWLDRIASDAAPTNVFAALPLPADRARERCVERLVRFARRRGLPVVAAPEVYLARKDDYALHRVLSAIKRIVSLDALREEDLAPRDSFLMPPEAVARYYGALPGAVRRAGRIAEACDVEPECDGALFGGRPIFPKSDLPEGQTPYSYLCKRAFEGLTRRYPAVRPAIMERLSHELSVIERTGFAAYFLIVLDIVAFCERRGIPVVGRGSAANSLAAYCLGITRADPMAHELYFERFLNEQRTDPPDIDLDIHWRGRDEVLEYVYGRHGKERVAMISTLATFQARSAFRDVAKAHGLALDEINALSKRLPHVPASQLFDAIATFPECRDFPVTREPYRSIVQFAMRMDGYPMHMGIHCGGVVIADRSLTDYVPLERAPKGLVVTQYDMHGVEALGLVKMDLLGHRMLAIIDDCLGEIRRNRGVEVRLDALPADDPAAAKMLAAGRTLGCFQIESPGMRHLLQMIRARNRTDVIMALSLIRPGPSSSGMKERFVQRRLGREPVAFLAPQLKHLLGDTFGVMLYQEDILRVAVAIAGFTMAEADQLRRAVDKGQSRREIGRFQERFLAGARERGVAAANARALWKQILQFAGYSYCKAHAVTYGYISYESVWLKTHYHPEFLAAVLSNPGGYYHAGVYVEEARRCGIPILGIDVNRSDHEYRAEGDAIRVGLMQLKNVSDRTVRSILASRKDRPFENLADFCVRTSASFEETKTLILAGAFDRFEGARPEKLWQIEAHFGDLAKSRELSQGGLFGKALPAPAMTRLPDLGAYAAEKQLRGEIRALDLPVSRHLMNAFAEPASEIGRVRAGALRAHVGRTVAVAGVLVASRHATTAKGEKMRFVSIEDETGLVEAVLFPKAYRDWGDVFFDAGPYLVTGKVESQHDAITLTVKAARRFEAL